ncbi:MAG: peptidase M22 [Ruminococcus sp.]|nr:peptidase M22 [Ruminococcus sp.]
MGRYLGIDTSNYTTSCALIDTDSGEHISLKRLLPVAGGERGLRQSDAVFHHTKQLPELMEELFCGDGGKAGAGLSAVGCSYAPREVEGSYMPCFLVGEGSARITAAAEGIPLYRTSHQKGHVLAALFGCGRLDLIHGDRGFLAFHVSGGTTDLLLCEPDKDRVISVTELGRSLDLKAGQCIDRIGVSLGLGFPAGRALDELSKGSGRSFKIRPSVRGMSCSLSGVENKCRDMIRAGEKAEDIAAFCLGYIYESIRAMTRAAVAEYGELPIVYAGGVMANSMMKRELGREFGGLFAPPELSSDNALGVAVYAAAMEGRI